MRVTDVYRKVGGKWLIVQEHLSLPLDRDTFTPMLHLSLPGRLCQRTRCLDESTVTLTGADGMPFATTTNVPLPAGMLDGTSNDVDTLWLEPTPRSYAMRAAVGDGTARGVDDAHERIVRRLLRVVTIHARL